ncbi:MAG: hypothetical protein J6T39_03135, partial [Clostridia bacterium]|nr:hypothetical protein [Clostridia bacterium]
ETAIINYNNDENYTELTNIIHDKLTYDWTDTESALLIDVYDALCSQEDVLSNVQSALLALSEFQYMHYETRDILALVNMAYPSVENEKEIFFTDLLSSLIYWEEYTRPAKIYFEEELTSDFSDALAGFDFENNEIEYDNTYVVPDISTPSTGIAFNLTITLALIGLKVVVLFVVGKKTDVLNNK